MIIPNLSLVITTIVSRNCVASERNGLSYDENLWLRFFTNAPRPRAPSEQRYNDQRGWPQRWTSATVSTPRPYESGAAGILPRTLAWASRPPRATSLTLVESCSHPFRQKILLTLDDCLHALQRLYHRHGISQLPRAGDQKLEKKPFKRYLIGYLHVDISEISTGEGKAYLFVRRCGLQSPGSFMPSCINK